MSGEELAHCQTSCGCPSPESPDLDWMRFGTTWFSGRCSWPWQGCGMRWVWGTFQPKSFQDSNKDHKDLVLTWLLSSCIFVILCLQNTLDDIGKPAKTGLSCKDKLRARQLSATVITPAVHSESLKTRWRELNYFISEVEGLDPHAGRHIHIFWASPPRGA